VNPKSTSNPLVVALTGGIASGKTTVSDAFAALEVPVIDTDLIAREVAAPGSEGLRAVRATFGPEVLDASGALDRARVRAMIFENDTARQQLEDILHPRIAAVARQRIAQSKAPYVVLVVPLLVESGLFRDADRVLVVDVPEALQIERLMRRDGATSQQARSALRAQASRQQRLAQATEVIDNTGTTADLRARIHELDQHYRTLAGHDPD